LIFESVIVIGPLLQNRRGSGVEVRRDHIGENGAKLLQVELDW